MVSPVAPVEPFWPVIPVLPVSPVAPVLPVAPVPPAAPVLPVLPVLPVAPVAPAGPGTATGTGTTAGVVTTVGLSQAASVKVARAISVAGKMVENFIVVPEWRVRKDAHPERTGGMAKLFISTCLFVPLRPANARRSKTATGVGRTPNLHNYSHHELPVGPLVARGTGGLTVKSVHALDKK